MAVGLGAAAIPPTAANFSVPRLETSGGASDTGLGDVARVPGNIGALPSGFVASGGYVSLAALTEKPADNSGIEKRDISGDPSQLLSLIVLTPQFDGNSDPSVRDYVAIPGVLEQSPITAPVAEVPEPASFAILGAGLLGLFAVRRSLMRAAANC
jgi:hypothetical protein